MALHARAIRRPLASHRGPIFPQSLTPRIPRPSAANARGASCRGEGSNNGQNSAQAGKAGQHGPMLRRLLVPRNVLTF